VFLAWLAFLVVAAVASHKWCYVALTRYFTYCRLPFIH
jgi:hypothetical protein